MATDAVRRAAWMNSQGASCLSQGETQKAMDLFSAALATISSLETFSEPAQAAPEAEAASADSSSQSLNLPLNLAGATDEQEESEHSKPSFEEQRPAKRQKKSDASSTTATAASVLFQDNAFFVCTQAMLFAANEDEIAERGLPFYKATLLNNLALCNHQGGHCVNQRSVYQALNLYDACLESSLDFIEGDVEYLKIAMAALNNKAHIFYEYSEFTSVADVLDTLLIITLFFPRKKLSFSDKEIQGILFNLHMLKTPTCARAA
jgi:hypothetical protein